MAQRPGWLESLLRDGVVGLLSEAGRLLLVWGWPWITGGLTFVSGYVEGVPFSYLIPLTAVTFAATATAVLRVDDWWRRRNARNKLTCIGMDFNWDLLPAERPTPQTQGNRHQRRAAAAAPANPPRVLSPTEISPTVPRNFDRCVLGATVVNNAPFPMSVIFHSAHTEIEGRTPPRGHFPRDKMTLPPGGRMTFRDDRIEFHGGRPCGPVSGKIDFLLKYGPPGKERFDLRLKADVFADAEPFGMVKVVSHKWTS